MLSNFNSNDSDKIDQAIRELAEQNYREAEIIRLLGLSRGKVRYSLNKLKDEQQAPSTTPTVNDADTASPLALQVLKQDKKLDDKKLLKVLRLKPHTIEELVQIFGVEDRLAVYGVLDELDKQGYLIEKSFKGYFIPSKVTNILTDAEYLLDEKQNRFKIGVVSDTHLSSCQQQLTHLNTIYDVFEKEGVKHVFHPGDMTAGNGRIFRGQAYEMFNHGADSQRDYLVSHYPRRDGITTHVIQGNHDFSFVESDGHDIIKGFARERDDIDYLGIYSAYYTLNGVRIHLQHGAGSGKGSTVLERYLNKYNDQNRPDILLLGHYHTAVMTRENGTIAMTGGGWESESPFLHRLGIKSEACGWLIEIVTSKETGQIIKFLPQLIVFPDSIEHDY